MRYFIGFLATVLLIIVLIILIFRGGGEKKPVQSTTKPLISYANTDAVARLTIDGPIVANSLHREVRISVDNTNATYEQINGYEGEVVNQKQYPNKVSAFENFLAALSSVGFTHGTKAPALRDERGFCPSGQRYIYEFMANGNNIQRFWSTSCGAPQSFLGRQDEVINLFQKQIPDYSDLTSQIEF